MVQGLRRAREEVCRPLSLPALGIRHGCVQRQNDSATKEFPVNAGLGLLVVFVRNTLMPLNRILTCDQVLLSSEWWCRPREPPSSVLAASLEKDASDKRGC